MTREREREREREWGREKEREWDETEIAEKEFSMTINWLFHYVMLVASSGSYTSGSRPDD